jgi:hypothetical protein
MAIHHTVIGNQGRKEMMAENVGSAGETGRSRRS